MIFLRYTPFIMNGTLFIRGPKTHSSDLGSYVVVEMFREYPFLLFRYKFLLKKIHTPWFCWVLNKKKKQFLNCGLILFWGKQAEEFSLKWLCHPSTRMARGQKLGVLPLLPSRFSCDVWHHPRDSSCHIILQVTEPYGFQVAQW